MKLRLVKHCFDIIYLGLTKTALHSAKSIRGNVTQRSGTILWKMPLLVVQMFNCTDVNEKI